MHLDDEGSRALGQTGEVHLEPAGNGVEAFALLEAARAGPGRWRIRLEGVESREQAAELTGRSVMVPRSLLDLDEGDLLVSDLPDREVVAGGEVVGVVSSVYSNGAHDVIVVRTPEGLVDVPLVEQHVAGPDGSGRLVVATFGSFAELAYDPPKGRKR